MTAAEALLRDDWVEQDGGQKAYLTCTVTECLGHGDRGGGKTDCLIVSYAKYVGLGYGPDYRGVIFRKTYKQLRDVVSKTKRLFRIRWPGATFNSQEMTWTFPGGEQLLLAYMRTDDDYWNHHGFAYQFIGWEELTSWALDGPYKRMFSCLRSAKGVPLRVRSTTNPYGVGHNWVKARFQLPHMSGEVIHGELDEELGIKMPDRTSIRITLSQNHALMDNDPEYRGRILAAARNPSERRAWASGDWDIVAGGMFDDLWDRRVHVLPDFPASAVPPSWRWRRAYDHGSAKPFSYGLYLESDGTPLVWEGQRIGTVRGDVIRWGELYGWQRGHRNEGLRLVSTQIGERIRDYERSMGVWGRVRPGPADTNIFDDYEPGRSVARDLQRAGVRFVAADKARKQGWEMCRKALQQSVPVEGVGREAPGFFACQRCDQFLELIPSAPRDDDDLDDVDTEWEDHIADEWRYFMRRRNTSVRSGVTVGV